MKHCYAIYGRERDNMEFFPVKLMFPDRKIKHVKTEFISALKDASMFDDIISAEEYLEILRIKFSKSVFEIRKIYFIIH